MRLTPGFVLTLPVWLVAAVTLMPHQAAGQASAAVADGYRLAQLDRPALLGTAGLLGVNAVLAGVSVGLVRELRGGSFLEGFQGGALAGGVVFLGKVVAAQRFSGAGLAGRQLAAVGGSMASNLAASAPLLSRLELPLGPARVVLDSRTRHLSLRADPLGVAVLTYAVLDPRCRFDAGATLSAGTPVFHADVPVLQVPLRGAQAVGMELSSVILLADMSALDRYTRADVLAHERVHTIQADAFQALWGRALLEWLAPDSPGWERVVGVLDLNLGEATAELVDRLLWRRGLWEIEAEYIGR